MTERDWDCYVRDMIEACERILQHAGGMSAGALLTDERTFAAVCYDITVIGKAVDHIPAHVHAAHPEIPWGRLADTRDHVVHRYWDIDHDAIRKIIGSDLPALLPRLRALLAA